MSGSLAQISLVLALVSIVFTIAMIAVVVFGFLKTGGTARTLILLAGALMLASQLSVRVLPSLLQGIGDRMVMVVAPTVIVSLFGLAQTICLVLAAVRAWGERPGSARPGEGYQPGPARQQNRPGTQPPQDPR